jgi:hypothetical protein
MPRGSISDEKGIDKIGKEGGRGGERGGASAPRPNFCFGPRTLILKKTRVTFFVFFSEPANFFMNAAPIKSVIKFQKSYNILERYNFCTRKYLKVVLKFSLAVGQRCYVSLFFMFFKSVQANFFPGHFWSTGRQIHNLQRYVFYVLYVSMFAYMNRVSICIPSSLLKYLRVRSPKK